MVNPWACLAAIAMLVTACGDTGTPVDDIGTLATQGRRSLCEQPRASQASSRDHDAIDVIVFESVHHFLC